MKSVTVAVSSLCLLCAMQGPIPSRGQDFGYDGHMGPNHWGERYRECTGKYQSPININILSVKDVSLPPLEMVGFADPIDTVNVTNNGHTVLIEVDNDPHPLVRGGPLSDDYVFRQMHFHWGENDTHGSEDKINYRSFAMELHMVFFKREYESFKQAVSFPDGLAVLAFFYELDRHNHPAYDAITAALANVTEPDASISLPSPFSLLDILPYDLDRYFTYRGSLTTPPCSEVVVWIDFEQPIRLAHDQMGIGTEATEVCKDRGNTLHLLTPDVIEAFRELKSTHGKITHNFRPIQPLGDRVVYYNSDRYYYENDIDAATTHAPTRKHHRNNSSLDSPILAIIALSFLLCVKMRSNI